MDVNFIINDSKGIVYYDISHETDNYVHRVEDSEDGGSGADFDGVVKKLEVEDLG